jgi:hypothetical protein
MRIQCEVQEEHVLCIKRSIRRLARRKAVNVEKAEIMLGHVGMEIADIGVVIWYVWPKRVLLVASDLVLVWSS